MRNSYRYLEHTADIKFEVFGTTKEDIFRQCVLAIKKVVTSDAVDRRLETTIKIDFDSLSGLLFDFISELIYRMEADGFLASDVSKIKIEDDVMSVTLLGDEILNYENTTVLKAMTYHEMVIEPYEDGWRAVVVIDI